MNLFNKIGDIIFHCVYLTPVMAYLLVRNRNWSRGSKIMGVLGITMLLTMALIVLGFMIVFRTGSALD